MNCLKISRPSVSFYKDVRNGKENSLGHILEEWGFFLDFVTQYFVDIFIESPKSFFTNKFINCSIFNEMSQK